MASRTVKPERPAELAPAPREPRATLHDVARIAGVSTITASRALRAPATVAPATRARIEEAVRELRYVPDLVARSFKSSRTGLVAAIVPNLDSSQYAEMLQGITDELHGRSFELMVGVSGSSLAQEQRLVRAFLGRRPEGLVLCGTRHTPAARELLVHAGVPLVEMGGLARQVLDMAVGYAEERAAAAMVDHLHACGYRRIGFVCGPLRDNERAQRRRRGYEDAVRRLGLPQGLTAVVPSPPRLRTGAEAFVGLLERHPDLDAVFCSSDTFAAGALFESQRRGIDVPERLGIAGFLGLELAAETAPALTTVEVPRYEIGRESARLLLRRLSGEGAGRVTVDLGFKIAVRGSTRSPETAPLSARSPRARRAAG